VFLVENFRRLRIKYANEHFMEGHRYEDPVVKSLVTDRQLRMQLVASAMKQDVSGLPREVKAEYRLTENDDR
jgi:hypothetical protein